VELNQFSDIAISGQKMGDSFVIQNRKLMKSSGVFTDSSRWLDLKMVEIARIWL
jgi:hypothetical protein